MRILISTYLFVLVLGIDLSSAQNKRKLDSLYTIVSKSMVDSTKKNAHLNIVGVLMKNDTVKGYRELRLLLGKLNVPKASDHDFRCIEKLASICYKNTMLQKNMLLYKTGLQRAEADNNAYWRARFYYRMASFLHHEDYSEKARVLYDSSIAAVPKSEEQFIAILIMGRGRAFYDVGNYKAAMDDYIASQRIFEKNKYRNENYGELLHYLGSLFKRQNLRDKALMYYEQELELAKELKDESMEAEALYLCAQMYSAKGDHETETAYELKALEIYKKLGNRRSVALMLGNMSSNYSRKGDYKTAIANCVEALEIYKELNEPQKQGWMLSALGGLYREQGQYQKALTYLTAAKEAVSKVETKRLLNLTEIMQEIALVNAELGNYRSAFENYLDYENLKDSLNNLDNKKYLSDLEKQYDTEKKEKEIALLNKDKEMQSVLLSKQATQRNYLIGGCVLVLIIAGVSIAAFINKQKTSKLLSKQVNEINHQNEIIKEKNKDITDSILYAKRLQEAVFPLTQRLNEYFAESFVLFRPKDIVSGDFYWFEKVKDHTILIVGDCTGHGVPGAFMSILGHNLLNQIILEELTLNPADILSMLDKRVTNALNKKGDSQEYNDGMDICVCVINKKEKKLCYAGANRPLILKRGEQLLELKQNKFAIGGVRSAHFKEFKQHEMEYMENDVLYMFSDGYCDQFGGPNGKKFKFKQLQELILANSSKPLNEQLNAISYSFESWKGNLEQLDDVCVVGVKI
jgi:serine phosphatase RsbU (regulator of sigma subunit)